MIANVQNFSFFGNKFSFNLFFLFLRALQFTLVTMCKPFRTDGEGKDWSQSENDLLIYSFIPRTLRLRVCDVGGGQSDGGVNKVNVGQPTEAR